MKDKAAIRIEIEYDNGEIWRTEGEDAQRILQHWQGGEVMAHIHGARYTGPTLVKIRDAAKWPNE